MKSVAEKIFYNAAGSVEAIPQNCEYQKCEEEYDKAYQALESTLDDEQKKLLNALDTCKGEVQSVTECLYFRKGLATGLRLGFEACCESDVLNTDEL